MDGFARSRVIGFAHDVIQMLFSIVNFSNDIDIHCVHELVASQRWNDSSLTNKTITYEMIDNIDCYNHCKKFYSLKITTSQSIFCLQLNYSDIYDN